MTGRRLDPYDEEPDPLYGDSPTLPQVRSPVITDPRVTHAPGSQIDLAHAAYHGDLLEQIRDYARRQAEAAERSADADVRSVEVLTGCRWAALGMLAGTALLVVSVAGLVVLWRVLT